MKPSDLLREVAEQQAMGLHGGELTAERTRLEEAEAQLRQRAANVIELFDEQGKVEHRPELVKDNNTVKVHPKTVEFTLPAPLELVSFIDPEQHYDEVVLTVTIGAHDVQFSQDRGVTWSEVRPCLSLDILTSLEGIQYDKSGPDYNYDELLTRLERLNYTYPVLDSFADDPRDRIPLTQHFLPTDGFHRIEGFHGALDFAEQYLGQPIIS